MIRKSWEILGDKGTSKLFGLKKLLVHQMQTENICLQEGI